MSITLPRTDIFSEHIIITDAFNLVSRQEFSRKTGGGILAKDFGRAVWSASFVSPMLDYDDAIDLETILQSLDGAIQLFTAHDTRRPFPKAYSDGIFGDTGVINSINGNNKAMTISALDANFILTRGDKLSYTYGPDNILALHTVQESVTANGSGLTPEFEVRPHIPDEAVTTTAVIFKKPECFMVTVPGSVTFQPSASTLGKVVFKGIQHI